METAVNSFYEVSNTTTENVSVARFITINGFDSLGQIIADEVLDSIKLQIDTTQFYNMLAFKQYELTNHLGNVLATVSDRRTPVGSGVDYFKADVINANYYYPYHSTMKGWSAPATKEYRFGGSSGQEKDNEVFTGALTAELWEYDSRLGRRWNLDPKPNYSLSEYAVYANNPIFLIDPHGDTTYVYNVNGQYAFTILDNLPSNEIVFLTDIKAKALHQAKIFTADQKARIARNPNFAYARLTENTAKNLRKHFSMSRDEAVGVLYIDASTKELKVWKCPDCKTSEHKKIGYGNAELGKMDLSDKGIEGEIFSIWHNHPLYGFGATQPSEYDKGNDFNAHSGLMTKFNLNQFKDGGVGVLISPEHITIFPLYNFDQGKYNDKSLFGLGRNDLLKPIFSKDYPQGRIKQNEQYGTFRNTTLGENHIWRK